MASCAPFQSNYIVSSTDFYICIFGTTLRVCWCCLLFKMSKIWNTRTQNIEHKFWWFCNMCSKYLNIRSSEMRKRGKKHWANKMLQRILCGVFAYVCVCGWMVFFLFPLFLSLGWWHIHARMSWFIFLSYCLHRKQHSTTSLNEFLQPTHNTIRTYSKHSKPNAIFNLYKLYIHSWNI